MDYEELLNSLANVFEKEFLLAYKNISIKGKNKLLKHMVPFYKKWYYSTFIEDTNLTPANLVSAINKEYHKNPLTTIVPHINYFNRLTKMSFDIREYSLTKHPIIDDLKIFLDFVRPTIELTRNNSIREDLKFSIASKLSLCDPYYVEYLVLISINLKLLKKMPSIYSSKLQTSYNYEEFFIQSPMELFDRIVYESILISVFAINKTVPIKKIINPEYMLNLLKNPIATDSIFQDIYSSSNLDLEEFIYDYLSDDFEEEADFSDEFLKELKASVFENTYHLSIVIDKYFFTVFGIYLKIINPCYLISFNLRKEFTYSLSNSRGIVSSVFFPCSTYTLTKLGEDYFEVKNQSKQFSIPGNLTFEIIVKSMKDRKIFKELFSPYIENYLMLEIFDYTSAKVYELRINFLKQKEIWIVMEFLEEHSLNDLYKEICSSFQLINNSNYSFFRDKDENPFSEYSSVNKRKNANNVLLKDFIKGKDHLFFLNVEDSIIALDGLDNILPIKNLKLEILVLDIKAVVKSSKYPRTIKEALKYLNTFRNF